MESEPMLIPREKSPLLENKFFSQEGRTRGAAWRRTASPTHYQLSYPGPNPRRVTWPVRNRRQVHMTQGVGGGGGGGGEAGWRKGGDHLSFRGLLVGWLLNVPATC